MPQGPLVRWFGDAGTGGGLGEDCVDLLAAGDERADAEMSRRWPAAACDGRVFGQLATRVQGQDKPVAQDEHRRRARRVCVIACELGADDARRVQT